jgi:hypothetical protein
VGFLDTVRRAAVLLRDEGRVSERALRREFDLDDQDLDDLVEELVEVRGVATRDGDVLVAVSRPETSTRVAIQEPSLRLEAVQPGSADTDRRDLTVLSVTSSDRRNCRPGSIPRTTAKQFVSTTRRRLTS